LFHRVIVPQAVWTELQSEGAPEAIHTFTAQTPEWLEVQSVAVQPDTALQRLGPGEREAILLAEALKADVLLIDERAARAAAERRGLRVTGLLGILDQAATRGLLDLPTAIERLRQTTFRASPRLFKLLLDRHTPVTWRIIWDLPRFC
jgi:predicted nucleic acid-binding protein